MFCGALKIGLPEDEKNICRWILRAPRLIYLVKWMCSVACECSRNDQSWVGRYARGSRSYLYVDLTCKCLLTSGGLRFSQCQLSNEEIYSVAFYACWLGWIVWQSKIRCHLLVFDGYVESQELSWLRIGCHYLWISALLWICPGQV